MTTLNRALPAAIDKPCRPSSRKDLLGVNATPAHPALMKGSRASRQWLTDLGFHISQPGEEHWVLTHTNALPELHFYNDLELERFATGKAHEYADRILRETSR